MSRLQRLRARALSLRGGVAIGGAVVMAASLTQVAGTLAAPDVVRTAKMPIASANYYPTPLPASISCSNSNTVGFRRANLSWPQPSPAGTYLFEVTVYRQDGTIHKGPLTQSDANYSQKDDYSGKQTFHVAVKVINASSGSGNNKSSGEIRHAIYHNGLNDTNCTGTPWGFDSNQPWENTYDWTPGTATFARQPLALGGILDEVPLEESEETLAPEATLTALDEELAAKADAPTPSETATTTATASPSSTRTSSSTPAATATRATTTRSAATGTATTTRSTATGTATTTRTTSTTTSTTTSAVPTVAGPVALAGGGEAEIVGDTTLVVSDGTAPVCTAPVREGSTLRVRSGVLELTDAGGTRTVDQETCELT